MSGVRMRPAKWGAILDLGVAKRRASTHLGAGWGDFGRTDYLYWSINMKYTEPLITVSQPKKVLSD